MLNNINTKQEKKIAKRDYREVQVENPDGFKKALLTFRRTFIDRFGKAKLKFNVQVDENPELKTFK